MTIYPHKLPVSIQEATTHSGVSIGATKCQARAPLWLAVGPVLEYPGDFDLARKQRDEMGDIFSKCPYKQWGAAAQAVMSVGMSQKLVEESKK